MTLSLGPCQPDSFTALKPPRVANQVGTALAAPAARWYRVAGKGARVPTILIVEDEPEITALLRSYLERDGHHVLTAADGEAAVREVEAAPPDLVVLGLMLPRLDGGAVSRGIRPLGPVPCSMLDSRDREEDRSRGLRRRRRARVPQP